MFILRVKDPYLGIILTTSYKYIHVGMCIACSFERRNSLRNGFVFGSTETVGS